MPPRYAVVAAPSILGLRPTGTEELARVLLELGLGERLGARFAAEVIPPPYDAVRDPHTGTRNAAGIAHYTPRLARAVETVLERGETPILLGGDCSILLGSSLALRRRGRYGLLFIDGHADFYQPEANPNGEAASMDLAFATGHGPRELTDFDGLAPLVRAQDVCAFGFRDGDEQRSYGSQPLPAALLALDLARVRALGVARAAEQAVAWLTRDELDGFFVHLDADCLSDEVMSAVDYRLPGGLSHEELGCLLEAARASGKMVGLEVTIYNPRLDPERSAGRALVDTLVKALASR